MSGTQQTEGWNAGDVFALLAEPDDSARPDWQTALQSSLGGTCTSSLHITCQKVTPADDSQLDEIRRIFVSHLCPLGPVALEGRRVEVWYSAFRETGILKCLVPVSESLERAMNAVNADLDGIGAERHYHIEPIPEHVPVTVLEGLDVDTELSETDHRTVQRTLFTATQLIISRHTERERFEIIDQQRLGT